MRDDGITLRRGQCVEQWNEGCRVVAQSQIVNAKSRALCQGLSRDSASRDDRPRSDSKVRVVRQIGQSMEIGNIAVKEVPHEEKVRDKRIRPKSSRPRTLRGVFIPTDDISGLATSRRRTRPLLAQQICTAYAGRSRVPGVGPPPEPSPSASGGRGGAVMPMMLTSLGVDYAQGYGVAQPQRVLKSAVA